MKKLLLTLSVVALFAVTSSAQLSVGVKGGLNLATLSGDDLDEAKMRPSLHIGGYLNLPLSEKLSLQPELLYSSVGAKFDESETYQEFGTTITESLEGAYKLSYISIPVMLQYSFGPAYFEVGPQISVLASAKGDFTYTLAAGGDSETSSIEEDIKDGLKGTDFGFNLGLGAKFGKLNAGLRYSLGLANVSDMDGDETKNNVFQLSIGYTLFGGE